MPSLSVVQTRRRRGGGTRRRRSPRRRSPTDPSSSPATNHLKPTGTSSRRRPRSAVTRSIIALETSVLPTAASGAPVRAAAEEVGDRRRQEVVRVQQARAGRDDAVPVGVGVVAERDVEPVAQPDEPGHRVRRRGVHPDPAVPVDGHEAERRVDVVVRRPSGRGRSRSPIARPVVHARAAQRIDAEAQARTPGSRPCRRPTPRSADVAAEEVVACRRAARAAARRRSRRTPPRSASRSRLASSWIQRRDVGVGRAAVGRVVLEAAVLGRVVRRRDDDPVGQAGSSGRDCGRGSRATAPGVA